MSSGDPILYEDYIVVENESPPAHHPITQAVLPEGWILVGGGARANYGTKVGSLLYSSSPSGGDSWIAAAKDHSQVDIATVTSFAIGVKRSFLEGVQLSVIQKSVTSDVTNWPSVECPLEQRYRLVGGGARANWGGSGSLLTASYPKDNQNMWVAAAKDHLAADPSSVTAWCIGLGPVND
jgi:hypothetical protein